MGSILTSFPTQKRSDSQKTKKWMKECIDSAQDIVTFREETVRKSYLSKKINMDLMNNILDPEDMKRMVDPFGLGGATFPAAPQNYPISMPKINVLVGEEFKRKFDWRVRVGNDNAISEKEDAILQRVKQLATEAVQNPDLPIEEVQKRLEKLNRWAKYEYQDIREENATNLLKYYWTKFRMRNMFNEGFRDLATVAEEIYSCEVIANDPVMRKLNPLHVHTIGNGESRWIQDADMIVIDQFVPIGQVIDDFHEELSPKEIDYLERGLGSHHTIGHNQNRYVDGKEPNLILSSPFDASIVSNTLDSGLIELNSRGVGVYGGGFDHQGNVRVSRVLWKSRRKLHKIKYYEPTTGEPMYDLVDEHFPLKEYPDIEVEKTIWVNEWWEGTKIGNYGPTEGGHGNPDGIYVKIGPRPVQMRDSDNPSICHPGIVGLSRSYNGYEALSLLDIMKPYQYLYNTFMYRTELAFAKSHGKMIRVDTSLVPDGMKLQEWFHYATTTGMILENPFNESLRSREAAGLSQVSRGAKEVNLEMSAYIQQHLAMLQYIKNENGEIVGVTPQREGQTSSRETLGGIERSIVQSNHITEEWYALHDLVKKKVLEMLLETAKYCAKSGKNKKLQYVTTDMSTVVLNIDMEMFRENSYDVHITDSSDEARIEALIEQNMQAAISAGAATLGQVVDIALSDSVAAMRRKIEANEEQAMQRAEEQAQREQQIAEAQIQAEAQEKANDRQHEMDKIDRDIQGKITIEQIKHQADLINRQFDNGELDLTKLEIEQSHESRENERDRQLKKMELNQKKEVELKKIAAMKVKKDSAAK